MRFSIQVHTGRNEWQLTIIMIWNVEYKITIILLQHDSTYEPNTECSGEGGQGHVVGHQVGGGNPPPLGVHLELLYREVDVEEVGHHEAEVAQDLVQEPLIQQHVGHELVPARGRHVPRRHRHDDEQ